MDRLRYRQSSVFWVFRIIVIIVRLSEASERTDYQLGLGVDYIDRYRC